MKLEPNDCLLHVVGEAMKAEPSLEAVKVDHDKQAISIATLGRPSVEHIEQTLTDQIATLQSDQRGQGCGLLRGDGNCGTCVPPNPRETIKFLNVRKDGGTTTISRVSCPTSPSFWRWHNLPWP